jgi:hypothetical protein
LSKIVATASADDIQVAKEVRSCEEPSEKVPVAVNCCICEGMMLGFDGVIDIDTTATSVTVSLAEPLIVVVPAEIVLAIPLFWHRVEPLQLTIFATDGSEEVQLIVFVISCDVPSEYVPIALYCSVVAWARLTTAGDISKETSSASVTVSVPDPEISPDLAVRIVVPLATEVITPADPVSLLITAIVESNEVQVTRDVTSCLVPSVNVPRAATWIVLPRATLGSGGVTSMMISAVSSFELHWMRGKANAPSSMTNSNFVMFFNDRSSLEVFFSC